VPTSLVVVPEPDGRRRLRPSVFLFGRGDRRALLASDGHLDLVVLSLEEHLDLTAVFLIDIRHPVTLRRSPGEHVDVAPEAVGQDVPAGAGDQPAGRR
jgi:hypothetical protein